MKTNFYLDTRKKNSSGLYSVKISVSIYSQSFYISTGIRIPVAAWDNRNKIVIPDYTNASFLNSTLMSVKSRIDAKILILQQDGSISKLRPAQLKSTLEEYISTNPIKRERGAFYSAFLAFIDTKSKSSTRQIYESTLHRIHQYECNAERLNFEDINTEWLEHFESWLLSYCQSANSRSIHFRNIRAVFNYARKHGKTSLYPFTYFTIKSQDTKHRCLTIQELRKLWNAETITPTEQRHLDTFKLIFCLIGINTHDLFNLQEPVAGHIIYTRAKTGTNYDLVIPEEAKPLIERLRGKKHYFLFKENHNESHNFTMSLNKSLKRICERIGIPVITSYWARHTWATIASSIDIPIDTIAQALGHKSHRVTEIYILHDPQKVTDANKKVLNYVITGIK